MGASQTTTPPSSLKARVLAAADQQPQLPPKVTPIERARSRRWVTRARRRRSCGDPARHRRVRGGQAAQAARRSRPSPPAPSAQVFQAADAHTKTVSTSNGGTAEGRHLGRARPDGRGHERLPKLSHRTYQMWAIRNGQPTSVGLIDDLRAGKVMPIPTAGTTVAITIEPAGGSRQPTHPPIIEVDPEAV